MKLLLYSFAHDPILSDNFTPTSLSSFPPGDIPLGALWLPVPSGLAGLTLPCQDIPTIPLLWNPYLLTTYTLCKTKPPTHLTKKNKTPATLGVSKLNLKRLNSNAACSPRFFPSAFIFFDVGFLKFPCFIKHGMLAFVSCSPPQSEVGFQLGRGWKHLYFDNSNSAIS